MDEFRALAAREQLAEGHADARNAPVMGANEPELRGGATGAPGQMPPATESAAINGDEQAVRYEMNPVLTSDTPAVTYDSDYEAWSEAPYELQSVRPDYRQTQKNISFIEDEIAGERAQAEQDDLISGLQKSMERDGVTTEDYNAEYLAM